MKIALLAVLMIAVTGAWLVHALEQRNLYFPQMTDYPDPATAMALSPYKDVEEVWFASSDGTRLNGWYGAPKAGQPTILFCHGNGGNIGDRWSEIETFRKAGYGFLMFDYRGYGKSAGMPDEQGLYRDTEAAIQYLVNDQHTPVTQQIAAGESLGGAVVIDAATRHAFRAVVVHSTFTSIPNVAVYLRDSGQMAWLSFLPIHWVMAQRFDSLSKISNVQSPLLIAHHDHDPMIPSAMAQTLLDRAESKVKRLYIVKGTTHGVPGAVITPELKKLLDESSSVAASNSH